MVATLIVLTSLLALAGAKPAARNLVVHEQRQSPPSGFVNRGAASTGATLKLRIQLAQGDMAGLERALYGASTPASASYGEYLSKEEVESYVAPKPETVKVVNDWLASHGIQASKLSDAGDWLGFTATVQQANELFDADYTVYEHSATGSQQIRTLAYSLPASLKGHVDLVHPTTSFSSPRSHHIQVAVPMAANLSSAAAAATCVSTAVTPACLQSLYGIPTAAATQASNKLLVTGYIEQYANQVDLKSFLTKYRTDLSSTTTFTLQTIDGGTNSQTLSKAGVEADLDTQYTVGIATGVPVYFLSVGETNSDGDLSGFLDTVNYVLAESAPPYTMSTSYGFNEAELSVSLANSLCNGYMQLGARGISFVISSGDGGVSGTQSQSCTTFQPSFPSGCPYITSVGATQGTSPETAASFSSGGFSNYFGTPSYQSAAVKSYISALGTTVSSSKYNASGRAFPDVSAQGVDYVIYYEGRAATVSGTSASTPLFASIIALLNDQLVAAGKSPLGFLNPWLYSTAATAFTDITSGDNPGCNTNGFPAKTGWDPVTGLGTPIFSKLKTAAGL